VRYTPGIDIPKHGRRGYSVKNTTRKPQRAEKRNEDSISAKMGRMLRRGEESTQGSGFEKQGRIGCSWSLDRGVGTQKVGSGEMEAEGW